jgi:hypothetical protein
MFKRSLIVAALVAIPCFGAYNPKDIFFEFAIYNGKGYFPKFPHVVTTMGTVMRNVPLYFVTSDNMRDYVKNVSFTLMKNENGTYDLRYKIVSSQKAEDMVLKNASAQRIKDALQDTFPNLQDSFFKEFLAVFSPRGESNIVYTVESLYALREGEDNKERFINAMKFVNHFLPVYSPSIGILNFDEKDLLVEEPKPISTKATTTEAAGWRSWFSRLSGWWRGQ